MNTLANFSPERFYHVFNRTNNKELLFRSDENRRYFLRQYIKYIDPFVQTYSYALLPTHFHFLISINSTKDLQRAISQIDLSLRSKIEMQFAEPAQDKNLCHQLITARFSRLFSSYSISYNKMYKRHGNLFSRSFKRSLLLSESKFGYLQSYFHRNVEKHGIDKNWEKNHWSSYSSLLSDNETFLNRKYVIEYFGGRDQFIDFHKTESYNVNLKSSDLEE